MIEDYNEIGAIADLITAQIAGTITDADKLKLEAWRTASPENARLYERYTSEQFAADKFRFVTEHDASESYRQLMRKIGQSRRKRKIRFYRYVGIIVFCVLVGGGFYLKRERAVVPELQKTVQIIPGSRKAILTLADGTQMDISNVTNGQEVIKEGATIQITPESIQYNTSDTLVKDEQYHIISIPKGGEYTLTLSDGSVLQMNSESEIRYPVFFRKGSREVFMKGEIYFQVKKDTTAPFIIRTEQGAIRVLGTSFNVRDYEDENDLATTLVSGKIAFEKSREHYLLKPGEQLKLDKSNGRATVYPVDTKLFCSWTEGRFVFEKQRLEDIMKTLSRWYDFDVVYENAALKDVLFTGNLKRYGELTPILDMLVLINKIVIDVDGKHITIKDRK